MQDNVIIISDGVDASAFVEPFSKESEKFSIFVKFNQDSRNLAGNLAQGLCKLFSIDPTKVNTLASLIHVATGSRPAAIVDELAQLRIVGDPVRQREASRGIPGTSVLETDAAIIELKPFRAYRIGEVVAFADPSRPCARKHNESNLYYGVVAEVSEPGNGGLRYVTLRSGSDSSISLLSTEVYSFKSAKEVAALQGPSHYPNRIMMPSSARFSLSAVASSSTVHRAGSTASQQDPESKPSSSDNKQPVVDTQDVLGALHGLLTRAGIPVSMQNEVI
jgi:hypothetical protein